MLTMLPSVPPQSKEQLETAQLLLILQQNPNFVQEVREKCSMESITLLNTEMFFFFFFFCSC